MQQLQEKVDELQRVVNAKDKLLLRKDAEVTFSMLTRTTFLDRSTQDGHLDGR